MKIKNESVPDRTYFRMSDVAPNLDWLDKKLHLTNGKGRSRSWGAPKCESLVLFRGRSLIVVFVGFCHKHGGGQGWFYFRPDGVRVTFRQLSVVERKMVVRKVFSRAPGYARVPGKID